MDEDTGLYYYGARYLDPTSAMWLSVDPLFEKYVGRSPYAYCFNNPVRYIDPTGLGVESSEETGDIRKYTLDEVVVVAEKPSWLKKLWIKIKNAGENWGEEHRDQPYGEHVSGDSWTGTPAIEPGKATEKYGQGMDGGLPSISKSGAGKNMESLSEFVGKFDWESIFEKFLPNNDNSPEQTPQAYQGPYALPDQTPQGSTSKPNEPKVLPLSITPEVNNSPKPSDLPFQDNVNVLEVDSAVIFDLYRAVDSVHQIPTSR